MRGILHTSQFSKPLPSFNRSKLTTKFFNKLVQNPVDNCKKHQPRTNQKQKTTPSGPLTRNGLWINEKNLSFLFYPLPSKTSLIPTRKTQKDVTHHGPKQTWKKKYVSMSPMHAYVKKVSQVSTGSKLVWVPKLTF